MKSRSFWIEGQAVSKFSVYFRHYCMYRNFNSILLLLITDNNVKYTKKNSIAFNVEFKTIKNIESLTILPHNDK